MSPPTHLVACPSCSRHLRVSEPLCPFCGRGVDADVRARPAPRPPAMRLSRAALFALGAATGTASIGCSSSSTPAGEADSGRTESSSESVSATALYGATATMSPSESDTESVSATALYGATATMSESGSTHSEDHDAGKAPGAAYGGPPVGELSV